MASPGPVRHYFANVYFECFHMNQIYLVYVEIGFWLSRTKWPVQMVPFNLINAQLPIIIYSHIFYYNIKMLNMYSYTYVMYILYIYCGQILMGRDRCFRQALLQSWLGQRWEELYPLPCLQ